MKSYCVKQRKQTECVPGSERVVQARNGRAMMKCKCVECGITKTKFVKSGVVGKSGAAGKSGVVGKSGAAGKSGVVGRGRKGKGLLLGKNSPFKVYMTDFFLFAR